MKYEGEWPGALKGYGSKSPMRVEIENLAVGEMAVLTVDYSLFQQTLANLHRKYTDRRWQSTKRGTQIYVRRVK